jgi:hypothetical protein
MDVRDSLPPVIRLLLSDPDLLEPANDFKALKRLMPELRRQAVWALEHFDYEKEARQLPGGNFVTVPAASADPFSRYGVCGWIDCRVHSAFAFARTFGLYADVAIVTDPFTTRLASSRRFSVEDYMYFQSLLLQLWILRPLIDAGVVRFHLPAMRLCEFHFKEFESQVSDLVDRLLPEFTDDIEIEVHDDYFWVSYTGAAGQRLGKSFPLTKKFRAGLAKAKSPVDFARVIARNELVQDMNYMMFEHGVAVSHQAALLSTSRLHMRVVREVEKQAPIPKKIEVWEDRHSANVPWISNLSPAQIVQLRDAADTALPRFREMVGRVLIDPTAEPEKRLQDVVDSLRAEAAEIRSEMAELKKSRRSIFRDAVGATLGMGITVYGLAAGAEVPASALLMGLLGLLHSDSMKEHEQLQKLRVRPGYVLVKAEDLLKHGDQKTTR